MRAIIDCGTTNTRIYLVDPEGRIVAQSTRKVGVRNTAMTGSKDTLRNGICEAMTEALDHAGLQESDIECAVASGMITSEIGLIELPHLVTPVGIHDLASHVQFVPARELLPLDMPILFIRGVRNNYGAHATLADIRKVDFMRGEETQVMGILQDFTIKGPVNILVLSSHTKVIHVNHESKIEASLTTLSGQLYEAIFKETMIGQSLAERTGETSGGYSDDEIVSIAAQVFEETGLDRCLMIPRFMQVLLQSDYRERNLFLDACIAADDLKCISDLRRQGYQADTHILFGHANRCALYADLLKKKFGDQLMFIAVSDKEKQSELTIMGALAIVDRWRALEKQQGG